MMKYSNAKVLILVGLLVILILSACGGADNEGASNAVESYYKGLINGDQNAMIGAACAAWEEQAIFDLEAFSGVKTRLEGFSCTVDGGTNDNPEVVCEGKIVATYGAEDRDFSLSGITYDVIKEGGEWRLCGQH